MLRRVGLFAENPEVRHQKPESHQRDARANPGEKCSLFGEIVPQVSHWVFYDRGIHYPANVVDIPGNDWVSIAIFGSVLRLTLLRHHCRS